MPAKNVMKEFKAGTLRSGSKLGPIVRKKAQAKAIQISEARKEGANIPEPTANPLKKKMKKRAYKR